MLKEKGIDQIVFDRNGYLYHGRIQALADAAREAGLGAGSATAQPTSPLTGFLD